jgi:NADH:ubiquinone oxidoreductase subunit 2 (subunit N)
MDLENKSFTSSNITGSLSMAGIPIFAGFFAKLFFI